MEIHGHICSPPLYEYHGWTFEFGMASGPWPVRKDGELFKQAGAVFYDMFDKWFHATDREQYRIGGGCQRF